MLCDNYTKDLLGLEDVIVKDVAVLERSKCITIEMPRKLHQCPSCETRTDIIHDYRLQRIKDIPSYGMDTYLHLRKRRYRCPACGKRFFEDTPFLPRYHRATSRLYAEVIESLRKLHSVKDVAEQFMLSQTSVTRIFDYVSYTNHSLPEVLSFDEFKGNAGGEKFQFIMTDPVNKIPLDILPSRKSEDLFAYFSNYDNRNKVKYIVIDMNRAYLEVIKGCFEKATVVIDKYHFVRQVTWAFENVRKEEQRKFHKDRRLYFKRSKSLLLKAPHKLTEDEHLEVENMLKTSERLAKAYLIKNEFYNVMKSKNSYEARKAFARWLMLENYDLPEFKYCFKTFINWMPYILNSFDCPFTNGYTEGVNNKIKVLKRISFGVRNFKRFRNRILHVMSA